MDHPSIRNSLLKLHTQMDSTKASPAEGASTWSDEFLLGFDPMDEVHEEFVHLVNGMLIAPQAELRSNLQQLATHLERHFALEDGWMQETEFPPRECHMNEHAAVMRSVREVQALLASADEPIEHADATARSLALALQDWFPGHATHLDSALAHWMCKQRHGGAPVVLRRNVRPIA
jgi:hemerythrin